MPDKVVTLEFQGQGITGLTAQVNALADAMGRLPSSYALKGGGASSALGSGSRSMSPSSAPSSAIRAAQAIRQASPQQAIAAAASQVKVSVTAIAQASAGASGAVDGLVMAITKLPAPVAAAVVAVGALVAGLVHAYNLAQSSINPTFQYGFKSVNSTGAFKALGTDNLYGKARSLSDAIATNPYARSAAYKAGINPNNSLYSGDLDDPAKALKWVKYLSSSNVSRDQAMRADRASGGQFTDEIARLRAASPNMRQAALDHATAQMNPEALRKAADAQIKLNLAIDNFSTKVFNLVDGLSSWYSHLNPTLRKIIENFVTGPFWDDPKGKSGSKDEKERMSRDKHTDAMNRFSNTVDGMFGGGSRTRNALPAGWGADQYQRQVYQKAAPMGVL